MKLSFSTLGCPDWTFSDIFSTAADLGYNGIEIRGIADEMYAPKIAVFSDSNLNAVKRQLERRSLEIPILTSGAYLCGNPDISAAEFEVKDYIMLADRLGVRNVRVLAEKGPRPDGSFDFDFTLGRYTALCEFADRFKIDLLIESNGALADSSLLKRFMEAADQPNMGVIWDIHHPYRYFGEEPETTVANIGKYIKHVHLKDSVKGSNGMITYMLTGYGDIPFGKVVSSLKASGYDGYLSYEWVKRWSRELAEPGVAFFQYINYMRELL